MKIKKAAIEINKPVNQMILFGFKSFFKNFVELYNSKSFPQISLFRGPKGIGKSVFAYHFVNYLLSKDEDYKYSLENFTINPDNLSYKLLKANSHPNFFLLDVIDDEKNIKIKQTRDLLQFLNKSTFNRNLKVVLIDNSELLNLSSANAILKSIEEPKPNTFFFIVHDSNCKILETIRSRCIEFNFFLKNFEKNKVIQTILAENKIDELNDEFNDIIDYMTPGNFIKYLTLIRTSELNVINDKLSYIFRFMDLYKNEKSHEILSFLSFSIENFYKKLCLKNKKNLHSYLFNKTNILNQIDAIKRFNLNEKNTFINIENILKNET